VEGAMFGKAASDSYFEKLFWEKRFFVQGIVRKYIRKDDLVDDLVQKTFLKLYLNIKKVKKAEFLNAYIHRITVNTVFDCLRKRSNEFEVAVEHLEEVFSGGEDTEKELNDRMTIDLFKDQLLVMPKKRRAVVSLRILEEKSFSEISSVLGISEVSARNLFSIAMKGLRTKLVKAGG
jgi:RNA polymerase sigma-70 factor (ECF subfamily)